MRSLVKVCALERQWYNKSRTNQRGLDIDYNDEVIMDSRIISVPQFGFFSSETAVELMQLA